MDSDDYAQADTTDDRRRPSRTERARSLGYLADFVRGLNAAEAEVPLDPQTARRVFAQPTSVRMAMLRALVDHPDTIDHPEVQ